MKLKITLFIKYQDHPEMMEIVERAGKEIVNLAREHEDLGEIKSRDAGVAYLDKSTTDRALQIIFQNPTIEGPPSHDNDWGLVLDNYSEDAWVVRKSKYMDRESKYMEVLERNLNLSLEVQELRTGMVNWNQALRTQLNFAIQNMPPAWLLEKMGQMTVRDRVIFKGRTLQDPFRTLGEIGQAVGLSKERVRQLDRRIINAFFSSALPVANPLGKRLAPCKTSQFRRSTS